MNFDELAKLGLDPAYLSGVVGAVLTLVTLVKRIPAVAERKGWLPAISVVIGVAVVALSATAGQTMATGWGLIAHVAGYGTLAGLLACGVYDSALKPIVKTFGQWLDGFRALSAGD